MPEKKGHIGELALKIDHQSGAQPAPLIQTIQRHHCHFLKTNSSKADSFHKAFQLFQAWFIP
jgi:hypothetical protein